MLKHSKVIEFLMDVPLPILTNKWVIKREKLTPGLEAVFFRDDGADLHCFLKSNLSEIGRPLICCLQNISGLDMFHDTVMTRQQDIHFQFGKGHK